MVIGIPSLNEADSIAFVVRQIDQGLQQYFPTKRAVIVNVDNNSSDGTREKFLQTKTATPKVYLSTPPGVAGKGFNFFNLFRKSTQWKAKAIAVFDADLRSITPEWVQSMLTPILVQDFDFCTPHYLRSEYDGSITNHICYPLIYGILGQNIRQPIGGDFALSAKFVKHILRQKWHKTTFKYGVDIFLTLQAIFGKFKITEVELGAKIHKPSAPKLGAMFSQVVLTLLKNICHHRPAWQKLKSLKKIEHFGKVGNEEAQTVEIDYKGMKASALFNFKNEEAILAKSLSKPVFRKLQKNFSNDKIEINAKLWCETVYDLVAAFIRLHSAEEIVDALKPIYFGRFACFFRETLEKNSRTCEREIVNQAKLFWRHRDYFFQRLKI